MGAFPGGGALYLQLFFAGCESAFLKAAGGPMIERPGASFPRQWGCWSPGNWRGVLGIRESILRVLGNPALGMWEPGLQRLDDIFFEERESVVGGLGELVTGRGGFAASEHGSF